MYIYIQSEPGLYTVGFYDPSGKWQAESDHGFKTKAADRVHWLNGGKVDAKPVACSIVAKLFTNGAGERANRLVLMRKPDRDGHLEVDLGGWCYDAVVDLIAKELAELPVGPNG